MEVQYPLGKPQLQATRNDSNKKILRANFIVIDKRGRVWKVPKGFITDGTSIPGFLQVIMGNPFDGVTEIAALIHDYYCYLATSKDPIEREQARSQKDTHRIFRELTYFEMKLNSKYSWFSIIPGQSKLWQYQRCNLMWLGVRAWNRLKHKDWR